jgi:hypothetical protein
MTQRKKRILVIGDVPNIFIERFKMLFRPFLIFFIPIVEKYSSGDEFSVYVLDFQPDFILITFEDYLKNSEFYDNLMRSFPKSIFWKIPTDKPWHEDEIYNKLEKIEREYLRKR